VFAAAKCLDGCTRTVPILKQTACSGPGCGTRFGHGRHGAREDQRRAADGNDMKVADDFDARRFVREAVAAA
jgi:hypothetical protein